MTRLASTRRPRRRARAPETRPGYWLLQEAKARFSELVRAVKEQGPQHVTVRGREEVVVVAADEFRRLKGGRTGADVIAAMQACPHPDEIVLAPSIVMPVREPLKF